MEQQKLLSKSTGRYLILSLWTALLIKFFAIDPIKDTTVHMKHEMPYTVKLKIDHYNGY